MTDFNSRSVAHGLRYDEFHDLPDAARRKLARLLWRLSEKSYRRGAQQGAHIARTDPQRLVDLAELRFRRSLDRAPGIDGFEALSARDRLLAESPELQQLGLTPRHGRR